MMSVSVMKDNRTDGGQQSANVPVKGSDGSSVKSVRPLDGALSEHR